MDFPEMRQDFEFTCMTETQKSSSSVSVRLERRWGIAIRPACIAVSGCTDRSWSDNPIHSHHK